MCASADLTILETVLLSVSEDPLGPIRTFSQVWYSVYVNFQIQVCFLPSMLQHYQTT